MSNDMSNEGSFTNNTNYICVTYKESYISDMTRNNDIKKVMVIYSENNCFEATVQYKGLIRKTYYPSESSMQRIERLVDNPNFKKSIIFSRFLGYTVQIHISK